MMFFTPAQLTAGRSDYERVEQIKAILFNELENSMKNGVGTLEIHFVFIRNQTHATFEITPNLLSWTEEVMKHVGWIVRVENIDRPSGKFVFDLKKSREPLVNSQREQERLANI